jgi:carotenoid phi-ring synthase / carotenoid chi-ring synthase
MKTWLRKKIRKKLQNYLVPLNSPDPSLPEKLTDTKKVAVVGGGIAGLSAAANLAERGFEVTIFEKDNFLCGKMGSWKFETGGESFNVEHGFHAFFRQYHNLRGFMKDKLDNYQYLIPIDDYVVLFEDGTRQGFKNLDPTPGLNVLHMRKLGVFNYFTLLNPFSIPFLSLLKFDLKKTYQKYDKVSFQKYARRTMMPKRMQMMFNTFARAFFSEPHKMSMAELIKGFHFYFLSNEDGLLYDVLNDDFSITFEKPWRSFLEKHGVKIHLNTSVQKIESKPDGFVINHQSFDYCVLATDVKHIKPLVENSPSLQQYSGFQKKIEQLGNSDRYAVLRIWTDQFENESDLPFFIFTDRIACLDSITLYHKMEKESAEWSQKNKGGIFELHCYALPAHLDTEEKIREQLMKELFHFMPALKNITVIHSYFQHKQDFAAFHVGLHANRPTIITEVPNLFLTGDWVKMDNCTMLMEAAFTSGSIAANEIFKKEGLKENQLMSVPVKGLLG